MNTKPRIAFCFSGQARTLDTTYQFIKVNLLEQAENQGFDYDIFCAVEDDEDVEKVNLLNPTKVVKIKSENVEKIIEEKYGDFIRTAFKTKYCFINYSLKTIKALLQQCYKIQASNNLKNEYSNDYDIVVRLRFDILFFNKIDFNQIKAKLGKKLVIDNEYGGNKKLGILLPTMDFFLFGDDDSMNIFGKCFDNFKEIFKGNEVKLVYKWVYYIFNFIVRINIKLNYNFYVNYIIHGFGLIFNNLFFKVYTPERFFYQIFIKNNISVIKTNISLILLRKDFSKSYIFLRNKTEYEI